MSDPAAARTAAALALFAEVCDLDEDARRAALDARCGDDPELRAEVLALLAADTDDDLDEPVPTALLSLIDAPPPARLGPFTLVEELGRGGMGTVYRARQERPARDVAVKVLDGRRLGPAGRRRFALEVELLGRLDHEGIARIHAAADQETGADEPPWFAMELVDGLPLLEYADRRGLDRRQRLELLLRVCEAVEHAHRHGVIHRDLKSANVLVTAAGQPKVLDFGVARAADHDLGASAELTAVGHIVGTLSCMSPEQARGDGSAVDTRTDVYALGVLLYQLLSGAAPLPLEGTSITEAVRRVVEEPPVPLARRDPALSGDLDVITGKALRKRPGDRYGSPGALAEDLRRHLEHRPILALPPRTLDRVLRFVRRQRLLVSAAAVLLVGLGTATVLSVGWWREAEDERVQAEAARDEADRRRGQAERAQATAEAARAVAERARSETEQALGLARDARQAAEQETARLAQLYDFLKQTLGANDPNLARGRELTVAEAVDLAASRLAQAPPDDPSLQASLHLLLGEVYGELTLADESLAQYGQAQALVDRHGLELLPATSRAQILNQLAFLHATRLEWDRAGALYEQLLALAREDDGLPRQLAAQAHRGLASLTTRPPQARLTDAEAALAIARETADDVGLAMALDQVAALLGLTGDQQRALAVAGESLELGRRLDVPSRIMQASSSLARLHGQAGDPVAHEHTRRMLEVLDQVLGPGHPQTANFLIDATRAWWEGSGQLSGPGWERLRGAPDSLGPAAAAVHPSALTTLAQLLWHDGDVPGARATLELALAPFAARPGGLDDLPSDAPPGTEAHLIALMLRLRDELAHAATGAGGAASEPGGAGAPDTPR